MKEHIEHYYQYDPKWKDVPLGPHTLGTQGCLVTCLAMLSHVTGHRMNPKQMRDELILRGGLLPDGLVSWNGINQIPLLHWLERNRTDNFRKEEAIRRVNRLIDMGIPVCVHVDNVASDSRPDHWVLMVGKFGEEMNMYDPWHGKGTFEAMYGEPEEELYGWSVIIGPSMADAPDKRSLKATYKILEGRHSEAVSHLINP